MHGAVEGAAEEIGEDKSGLVDGEESLRGNSHALGPGVPFGDEFADFLRMLLGEVGDFGGVILKVVELVGVRFFTGVVVVFGHEFPIAKTVSAIGFVFEAEFAGDQVG